VSLERLDERIVNFIAGKGWDELTEPQARAIPPILDGEHVLLVAPTGIGKTEAAVLPILHNLLNSHSPGISALYVTPLRALNRDMLRRLTEFAEELDLDVAVRHGDTTQKERNRQSKHPPQLLITTPETVQIMLTGKRLREHLKNLRWVVVDEIHELAEDERGAQLSVALERLVRLAGREIQRIGLSATLGNPDEAGRFLGGAGRSVKVVNVPMAKKMIVTVESPEPTEDDHAIAEATRSDDKQAASLRRCRELVEAHRSTLFFVNTRDTAEALSAKYHVWDEELPIGVHHGSLSKDVRVEMEDDFKAERLKALVCTSSLELGIDVGSADFTIQFNSPRRVVRLVQRLGRAGHRIGETSEGVIIATDPDDIAEAAVIARRTLAGELEPLEIRPAPLSVVANQVAAALMESPRWEMDGLYETIVRAYPFRDLPRKDFDDIVQELFELGVVWKEGDELQKRRGGLKYFYDNISMIPDERTYRIRDIATRGLIGSLDESFVASYIKPQVVFIVKGRTWEVVDIQDEEVLVRPVKDVGAIPSWVGEDIPVPFAIAQEVGRLRRERLWSNYPVADDARTIFEEYIEKQLEERPVPDDETITLEDGGRLLILNSCLGSKGNETLGRLLSGLLMARVGESIGLRTDPYRVLMDMPRRVSPVVIEELLLTTNPDALPDLIRLMLRNSSYLKYQFFHVARKFGAIKREVDFRNINLDRLMEAFRQSVMYRETVEKVLWEEMDLPLVRTFLEQLQSGEVEMQITGLSKIGLAGYERNREFMVPQRADHAILMALKKRIEAERVAMACTSCGTRRSYAIVEVPKRLKCDRCGSVLLAPLSAREADKARLFKKKRLSDKEKKEIRRLRKGADLVMAYGGKAVFVLGGRGIGPDAAARILARVHVDEDDLLRDILQAEINYARTKAFWD